MQDPSLQIPAWNTQAVEEMRGWMQRIESKMDKHIAEGQQVKTDIAVLASDKIDPSRVAVLEARVAALTRLVWGMGGVTGTALAAVALKYLGV